MTGCLTVEEMNKALLTCARLTQEHFFEEKLKRLKLNVKLPRSFQKLSPFISSDENLIRVGGRLAYSQISYGAKHPIPLPQKAHLSRLICNHFHLFSCHGGPNAVQALIQQKFWIFSLR